jgi:hypothetical protein
MQMYPSSWRVFYQALMETRLAQRTPKCTPMSSHVVCFDYTQYTSRLLPWTGHFSKLVKSRRGVQQQKPGRFKTKPPDIL